MKGNRDMYAANDEMALQKLNTLSLEELEIYRVSIEAIVSNPMISAVDQAFEDMHPSAKLKLIDQSLNDRKVKEAPETHY